MDSDEAYILLLLSDGNLPTGSFVASAGLESFVTHGFFTPIGANGKQKDKLESIVDFVRDSVTNYAQSALAFVSDAHQLVQAMTECIKASNEADPRPEDTLINDTLHRLIALDALYETMTLNHVSRRASRSQGVALLSLYSKSFTKPASSRSETSANGMPSSRQTAEGIDRTSPEVLVSVLVDKLKLSVRREDTYGHLPVCWGVLTAALSLSLERSQFLHVFLYARGLISAGVRMNTLGPYAAQQLLLHDIRPIVTVETARCSHLRTGLQFMNANGADAPNTNEVEVDNGPAMTWPLGEILSARHDLQHSRIFNS